MKNCATAWKAKSPDAAAAASYKAWSTTCLKADYKVASGAAAATMTGPLPEDATAQCKDGTYTTVKGCLWALLTSWRRGEDALIQRKWRPDTQGGLEAGRQGRKQTFIEAQPNRHCLRSS
jgi:hypothetical protein